MCGDLQKLQLFLEKKKMVVYLHKWSYMFMLGLFDEGKIRSWKTFQTFYNMIETQFQVKIGIFHTNNGTEYFNEFLGSFFERKRYPPSIYLCEYPSTKWNC